MWGHLERLFHIRHPNDKNQAVVNSEQNQPGHDQTQGDLALAQHFVLGFSLLSR
jgi:hypothetical protein